MLSKNLLPKSCLAFVAILLAIIHSPQQAHADIIIAGYLIDSWGLNGGNQGGNSNSLLAQTGDIQNPLVGGSFTNSISRMQWNSNGNVIDLNVAQEFSYVKPSGVVGVSVDFNSGFDVYAPAGTTVKLDYLGGQVSGINSHVHVNPVGVGTGLTPWTFTETIGANPNFRISFEGREYFRMLNIGFGLPSLNMVRAGSRGATGDSTSGSYNGTFNWRVTNLSAVPEPTSLMLVGLVGITALGARRRFGFLRSSTSDSGSTPIEQAAK